MNNEEKIMQTLDKILGEMTEMRSDISKLNQNVAKIEVEHGKKLDALFDGHLTVTRQLAELKATVAEMAPTVVALDVLHQMREHK